MTTRRPLVFGSPEARAIAAEIRAAEAYARRLENPPPRPLTAFEREEERLDYEYDKQCLAAWNAWAQGKQQETTPD